ncbi:MAG: hypothetical protein K9G59_11395 [Caulobacter sp.]|nr:hypothetical protein [Caulobacter sp.]
MSATMHTDTGYALVVQPDQNRWLWALMDLDAVVAASGTADNRDSAWKCGAVAAATFAALQRRRRRSV